MKKKILLYLLVIMSLITFVGCGTEEKEADSKKEEKVVDKTLFKIKDKNFHLDTDKEFEGLKYKISSEFKEVNNFTPSSTYVQYNYQPENSSNYFYFRIFYYKGKSLDFAKNDYVGNEKQYEYKDIKINDIEYKMIDEERVDGTIHHYFIVKDGSTYVLSFISQNDINKFESMILDSVKF